MSERAPIEPGMKVAALLEEYPELEEVLIGIAPPFQKLRNPVLRRSVAKVASLRQAAAVARIPVGDLINQLLGPLGEGQLAIAGEGDRPADSTAPPEWVTSGRVVSQVDAKTELARMPILAVLERTRRLRAGELVELRTDFLPAPGIDLMRQRGLRVWSRFDGPGDVRTFVACSIE